jgi:integrase
LALLLTILVGQREPIKSQRVVVGAVGAPGPRRGHGEDSIYFDRANNRWVGAISLGYKAGRRVRRKVTGRTKTEVKVKLRQLRHELETGVHSSATYTVNDALDDWLAAGLGELTAGDVQETINALAGRLSTRSLQIIRNCLERAIRHAEIRDLTGRNVAALVKPPTGRPGRPSRSLTLEQARALLEAARDSRLNAYVVVSVRAGLRTEELRALRWSEVDLDAETVGFYRAARASGDTKTQKSRRVLLLPKTGDGGATGTPQAPGDRPAGSRGALAGSRPGVCVRYWHPARPLQCAPRVPEDHPGCRSG